MKEDRRFIDLRTAHRFSATDGDQVLCETGEECCGNHSNVEEGLISETLDIKKTIVNEIVSESLGMRKVCAKLVPK
ncbi:hypothetical protein NQ318_021521, partial [Aromia moschata]